MILELEVSPSNRVSRRDEKAIEPSRVVQAVVTPLGNWMATLDTREGDESFRGEIYLKLWHWDDSITSWILNTRVDRPHGLEKVTAIAFNPAARDQHSQMLVTTGNDGNVKSWRTRTAKQTDGVAGSKSTSF
jgi:NET1-associated nuclear protein 1 (U3 small nucleolar RNA-associated protein 17)